MKINAISNGYVLPKVSSYKKQTPQKQNVIQKDLSLSYHTPLINQTKLPLSISFMGQIVHIVDGGAHATNMQHFANAISSDMDIKMHNVEVVPNNQNTKQLKDLEKQLKLLNNRKDFTGEYIAIPALASVPILNIQDQYNRVMYEDKEFTPENLKANKKNLLQFLKEIYENPEIYSEYIGYMDSTNQGIQYTYGVIREINKLIEKGAKVYIPSGHPQEESLKWLAGQRNLKPELYYCISEGRDIDHSISKLHKEIKDKNWYEFNLLSLSEANVVGVKGVFGALDYMFAAYDSCITDGARGVYNFSPVRENGKLIGYSYTDTVSNQYPYEEFPANNEVANLTKFVGKQLYQVLADKQEIAKLKQCKNNNASTSSCADKLYPVKEIFSEEEIKKQKIELQGDYVDKNLKLFFKINDAGEVIFPKCDCEGTKKPSVISMWGSCFSVFNAIARDINYTQKNKDSTLAEHEKFLRQQYDFANMSSDKYKEEAYINSIEADKAFSLRHKDYINSPMPHYLLGELYLNQKKYTKAQGCFNTSINFIAKRLQKQNKPLYEIKSNHDKYVLSKQNSEDYEKEKRMFERKPYILRIFLMPPFKPFDYNEYKNYQQDYDTYQQIKLMAQMYEKLAQICKTKQEDYPAKVCTQASKDILDCNQKAKMIIQRRNDGVLFIGDLYSEIKPN